MKAYLTTLCGCHKEMDLQAELGFGHPPPVITIAIATPTPWSEPSLGPSMTYSSRKFGLVGISNQPAAYYEEVL